jgi:threonine aldolase
MPAVLEAIARETVIAGEPYGEDETTHRLSERCADFFETSVDVYPVATGTAANSLCLATTVPHDGIVFCSRLAHIYQSESGAVELANRGARVVPLSTDAAKVDAPSLTFEVERLRAKSDLSLAPSAVSISQATELGTLYEAAELRSLAAVCRQQALALHMDGARLFHALAASGRSPADLTWRAGVDVLSLGMTKCGGLFGEVVIGFRERLQRDGARGAEVRRRRRRAGHTLSKMRFVSAQLLALLEHDRWRQEATHANNMAGQLAEVLRVAAVATPFPVETNQVFCQLTDSLARHLREAGWQFRDWPAAGPGGRRFVTSSLTTPATARALAEDLARFNS